MLPVAILMGGLGTRVLPLTKEKPKALLPIADEPFLSHQLKLLRSRGVERVVLCVGYLGDQISEFVGDGSVFGLQVDYSWDGEIAMGTAGALRKALPKLDSSFFVIYGDSYLQTDYLAAEAAFVESGKQGLMTVFRNDGQWDSSNVEFDGRHILDYSKKQRTSRMHYIDYGLSLFRSDVFRELPEEPRDLSVVHRDLLQSGQLAAMEVQERFYETGSFEGIRELTELFQTQNQSGRKDV